MWEYAAIAICEIDLSTNFNSWKEIRWVLTSKTSSGIFAMKNHPKLNELANKYSNLRPNHAPRVDREVVEKVRLELKIEIDRILENNELPNVIIIGLDGEDDLDIIRMAAAENWETTGRTPGSNQIMMRRRIQ